jgi:hypothetical protein
MSLEDDILKLLNEKPAPLALPVTVALLGQRAVGYGRTIEEAKTCAESFPMIGNAELESLVFGQCNEPTLAQNIREGGFDVPLMVDEAGQIILAPGATSSFGWVVAWKDGRDDETKVNPVYWMRRQNPIFKASSSNVPVLALGGGQGIVPSGALLQATINTAPEALRRDLVHYQANNAWWAAGTVTVDAWLDQRPEWIVP